MTVYIIINLRTVNNSWLFEMWLDSKVTSMIVIKYINRFIGQ